MSKSGFGKFLIGASIGVGIGLLIAQKSGKETRKDIKEKFEDLERKFQELDYNDVKEGAMDKLDQLKAKISELDHEKALDITKSKITDIKTGLNELCKYVKKKSVPVIKKMADDISNRLSLYEKEEENKEN